jgi:Tfp pilus assembly protein PilP
MRSALTLLLGTLLAAAAPGLRAQAKPAPAAGVQAAQAGASKPAPAQQTAKPASPAAKPGATAAKPAGKPAAKPVVKKPVKPAAKPKKPVETAVNPDAPKEGEEKIARRDPFESLISRNEGAAHSDKNLPPGKAGLQVSTLRLDGVVKAPNGMIAVVSNPQSRTYFLREGDQLYDGRVEKIAMDGVSFHEIGKDAFGKPVERQVNKRLYSSAPGEAQ